MNRCKLCLAGECAPAGVVTGGRQLLHCLACGLVFVPERFWLSRAAERARYSLHDNTEANAGYARFLGEVAAVVRQLLPDRDGEVLDFGCGEHAVLSGLLRNEGFSCTAYDPLYGLGEGALQAARRQYRLIVVCEVIEHLRDLRGELEALRAVLTPGGKVVVRTRLRPGVSELPTWWYARDPTHINFFAETTLPVVARLLSLSSPSADRFSSTPDLHVFM